MKLEIDYWQVMEKSTGENRYIWLNGNTWWASITLINSAGNMSVRSRFSLKTDNIDVARKRRDRIITAINSYPGMISVRMSNK